MSAWTLLSALYVTTLTAGTEDLDNTVLLFYPEEEGTWKRLVRTGKSKTSLFDAG